MPPPMPPPTQPPATERATYSSRSFAAASSSLCAASSFVSASWYFFMASGASLGDRIALISCTAGAAVRPRQLPACVRRWRPWSTHPPTVRTALMDEIILRESSTCFCNGVVDTPFPAYVARDSAAIRLFCGGQAAIRARGVKVAAKQTAWRRGYGGAKAVAGHPLRVVPATGSAAPARTCARVQDRGQPTPGVATPTHRAHGAQTDGPGRGWKTRGASQRAERERRSKRQRAADGAARPP